MANLLLSWFPKFEMTEERKKELRETFWELMFFSHIVSDTRQQFVNACGYPEDEDDQDLGRTGNPDEDVTPDYMARKIFEAFDVLTEDNAEISEIDFDCGLERWITGGMSYGDLPTESARSFELLTCLPEECFALCEQYAREDYEASRSQYRQLILFELDNCSPFVETWWSSEPITPEMVAYHVTKDLESDGEVESFWDKNGFTFLDAPKSVHFESVGN